jgi:hypothetical protein
MLAVKSSNPVSAAGVTSAGSRHRCFAKAHRWRAAGIHVVRRVTWLTNCWHCRLLSLVFIHRYPMYAFPGKEP